METRIVRLSSGEEVICKTETDGETTKIKNAALLVPMGGGQLGMFLAKAAKKINIEAYIYSNTKDAPAKKYAKKMYYGPFEDSKKLINFSNELKNYLSKKISGKILGPVQAPIYKIKKKYRNRLLIRASKSMTIQNNLSKALKNFKIQPEIKLTVDVDPISFN